MSAVESKVTDVINGVLLGLKNEDVEAFKSLSNLEVVQEGFEAAKLGDYQALQYKLLYPLESFVAGLVTSAVESEQAQFILSHSAYLDAHLSRLFSEYEGSPFCSDKSGVVIESLLKFYMEGKQIEFNYDQEYTYHLPKKILKTHGEIIQLFNGLWWLHDGQPKKYLEALKAILPNDQD